MAVTSEAPTCLPHQPAHVPLPRPQVRSDSAAAQRQLAELERLKAAWLPFWAEEATASVRAAAAPAVQQAVEAAKRVGGQVGAGCRRGVLLGKGAGRKFS